MSVGALSICWTTCAVCPASSFVIAFPTICWTRKSDAEGQELEIGTPKERDAGMEPDARPVLFAMLPTRASSEDSRFGCSSASVLLAFVVPARGKREAPLSPAA